MEVKFIVKNRSKYCNEKKLFLALKILIGTNMRVIFKEYE